MSEMMAQRLLQRHVKHAERSVKFCRKNGVDGWDHGLFCIIEDLVEGFKYLLEILEASS